jgi:excisionase family DNA binding protein
MMVVDGVEMLDVREAAELLRRTSETVRRWMRCGRLDAVRRGNRLLVARNEIADIVSGGPPAEKRLSLAEWVHVVHERRHDGALPRSTPGTSAADLVIADRRSHDDS